MDCAFLLNLLGGIKSWSESEIEAVKQQIRQQVQKQLQAKADELTKTSQQPLPQTQQQKFTQPQNRQINQKAADIHQALQGGVTRGLERPTINTPTQGLQNQPNVPAEG
jgi:flagellar biosynthesis GTPase FlhF